MKKDASPLVLGFTGNLLFSTRIGSVLEQMGYQVRWIESATEFGPDDMDHGLPSRQFGEPLLGRGAVLIDEVSLAQPVLILLDLDNPTIPWRRWLPLLKSVSATRRIPVLAFGPHMDVDLLADAKKLGADGVLARSRLMGDISGAVNKYARIPDFEAIEADCLTPLSPAAILGLQYFNQGKFFEAHEELELAWNEDNGAARELYRAVLQIAVAYLQITRGNFNGARKIFLRARQWFDPLPDFCRGIDLATLKADAEAAHNHLLALGAERIAEYDRLYLRPVKYTTTFE